MRDKRGTLSQAVAMRVLAVIVTLVLWTCPLHAHLDPFTVSLLPRAVLPILGINQEHPVHYLLECAQTLGLLKCVNAFGVWRTREAVKGFVKGRQKTFNLTEDVKSFQWKDYVNSTEEQIESDLCDSTEELMRYRSLSLFLIPGYKFELGSKGNGTLNVDIFQNAVQQARSNMKKMEKRFYKILPFLMVPGLIMSAILPFILPALKLMTVGVGMLNNMVLTGAIFTLLRNNAFNDKYDKKVVYSNEGYKNEKNMIEDVPNAAYENFDIHNFDGVNEEYVVEGTPTNSDWINQYYEGKEADTFKVKRKIRGNW